MGGGRKGDYLTGKKSITEGTHNGVKKELAWEAKKTRGIEVKEKKFYEVYC